MSDTTAMNLNRNTLLRDLPLSARIQHVMENDGLMTVGDVLALSDQELLRMPNFGRVSFDELKSVLAPMMAAEEREAIRRDREVVARLAPLFNELAGYVGVADARQIWALVPQAAYHKKSGLTKGAITRRAIELFRLHMSSIHPAEAHSDTRIKLPIKFEVVTGSQKW